MQKFLLMSTDRAYKSAPNVQKRVCSVYLFQLSFHFACHRWWLAGRIRQQHHESRVGFFWLFFWAFCCQHTYIYQDCLLRDEFSSSPFSSSDKVPTNRAKKEEETAGGDSREKGWQERGRGQKFFFPFGLGGEGERVKCSSLIYVTALPKEAV